MAPRSRRRKVSLSGPALETLCEIWHWNADRYGDGHADGYVQFLIHAIEALALPETAGRPIAGRPDLAYLLIRRRSGGHGHIAVFSALGDSVCVLRLFHTAQDWQSRLAASERS